MGDAVRRGPAGGSSGGAAGEAPEFDYPGRRERALAAAGDAGAAALLVTGSSNIRYLSGFTGSNGTLALLDGATLLVTDGRYVDQATAEAPGAEVVVDRNTPIAAAKALAERGVAAVAVEADHLAVSTFERLAAEVQGLEMATTTGLVESLRRRKDAAELALIATACRIASEALDALVADVRPGLTERGIARRLAELMYDGGAESPAFATIVAAGPNSAIPHHQPMDRALQAGDLLKIDAGATWCGYRSDLTRTYVVGADPTPQQRELHDAVASAAAAARARVLPGVPAADLDAVARKELARWDLADRFSHGLGHGVGLDIHELPMVGEKATATIEAADVLTVEPGVYISGFGGVRIEDTLAVTPDGADCLTTCPRNLLRLG